jgi:hypothetical protein
METYLLAVILLQFIYLIYSDFQNRKERETLSLKLMSKNLSEYVESTKKEDNVAGESEEDPYLTMDEAGLEAVLKAKV